MLKPGGFNRVACAKITEYHTRALSQRPKAKDVLFRACKHRYPPAPPCHVLLVRLKRHGVILDEVAQVNLKAKIESSLSYFRFNKS